MYRQQHDNRAGAASGRGGQPGRQAPQAAGPWGASTGYRSVAQGKDRGREGVRLRSLGDWIDTVAPVPWQSSAGCARASRTARMAGGAGADSRAAAASGGVRPLYTPEERARRDSTVWTLVQGVLAPVQFAVFLFSLGLVLCYLDTGLMYEEAALSVVVKTVVLYGIMVTGSIWEKVVFGKWLFAPAFFWEDVVSMLVMVLHTAYVVAWLSGWGHAHDLMLLALAAYGTYLFNAVQYILKLRAARLEGRGPAGAGGPLAGAA